MSTLLIKNIGRLQTPVGSYKHCGKEQGENIMLVNAAILAVDGVIKEITTNGELPELAETADTVFDAEGKLVTPGLVEGHTHLVFGGYRQNEIPLKLKGASYLDILKAGGGIHDTVSKTREMSIAGLFNKSEGFLDEMLNLGVTTCEIKSGYGLDFGNEMKMLEVINQLGKTHPMDIVPTFMGAHAVPEEYKDDPLAFVETIVFEWMPYIKELSLAKYCDIFCEEGVFDVNDSRVYLEAAKKHGFGLKIHADEIEPMGGSELAGELGATSAEHLIAIGETGLKSLAEGGTVAMLLPGTSFYLDKPFAPARKMIEMGIPVAIASDFNPGSCPSLNLQFCMNLGYLKYKMTPEEILTAVTINSAAGIGMEETVGTLEVGKKADIVVWDAPNMEMLCYRFGSNLAAQVIKGGELV
ncbi:MAG: imidazolonepropionase [Anaerovoracaceae bacterium]